MKLTVCYDPGTSLTKVLYQTADNLVKHLTIEPEIIELPAGFAKSLPLSSGLGKPQDNAWVRLDRDGDCYVVGRLAKNYSSGTSFKQLNHTSIVPKLLAAIGAIAQREKIGDNFEVNLGLLLPYREIANRRELERQISQSLRKFYFRDRLLCLRLAHCYCLAEGGGIALSTVQLKGIESFKNQTIAFIVLGYRHTSVLLFKQGTLLQQKSATMQLGFYDLLEKFCNYVPGLSREQVRKAIVTEVNQGAYCTRIAWGDLLSLSSGNEREDDLVEAFELAKQEYWRLIDAWLDETLPPSRQLDSVICGGGAAALLEQNLKDRFGYLEFARTQQRQLLQALQLNRRDAKTFDRRNLAARFADCWGFFVNFAGSSLISLDPAII